MRIKTGIGLAAMIFAALLLPVLIKESWSQADIPPATGRENPDLAPFDQLMTSFVQEQKLPGAALAITRNGRLVYARGFGYADADAKEAVQPNSLFRIASISKSFTSVAILQLAERGRIKLDDRVFKLLPYQSLLAEGTSVDGRLFGITLYQLLHHTGGWDRGKSFDPMFASRRIAAAFGVPPPATQEQIIRYMMGMPLDFDPGERHAYSNFGYCLLGRIIEQTVGSPYEDYIRKEILEPLGIHDMRLGKTLLAGRASGEVKYYDPKSRKGESLFPGTGAASEKKEERVDLPYGVWCLESMDSHGGWIASAIDLVKFASAFDDPGRCKLLNEKSVRVMFERPEGAAGFEADGKPKAAYYGCGWMVRPIGGNGKANTWHNGSLDGTSTLMVRRWDGLDWAVLFNSRSGVDGKEPAGLIDSLLHRAADSVKRWPDYDLLEAATGR